MFKVCRIPRFLHSCHSNGRLNAYRLIVILACFSFSNEAEIPLSSDKSFSGLSSFSGLRYFGALV